MKKHIFNDYVKEVCKYYDLEEDLLFSKDKKPTIADARHLLFYLCKERPIKITYIQKYMKEKGYRTPHSTIIYGHRKIAIEMQKDKDTRQIVNEIKKCTN
jgi:chromosomal replication initiation ATPase DnaA|tara:strand:+ start:403 stop:702 length:300 start_codon:yes stop_codon:yes gene_type:complete